MIRKCLYLGIIVVIGISVWIFWAENNPEKEKALRSHWCEQMAELFPDELAVDSADFGLFHRSVVDDPVEVVVLIHGLDEPGDIWDDLVAHWSDKPVDIWEFRYPNDQSVSESADLLDREWSKLSLKQPCTLIGHSMGGLVARAFLGTDQASADVSRLIMLGTPNQGSEWARFRVWLELRDHFPDRETRRFSFFSALRDGCGEAKIDLRPGSRLLEELNARSIRSDLRVLTVAGLMGQDWIDQQLTRGLEEGESFVTNFWEEIRLSSEALGDGVVPLESTFIHGWPAPLIVDASHRGMIRNLFNSSKVPPAIPLIDDFLGL